MESKPIDYMFNFEGKQTVCFCSFFLIHELYVLFIYFEMAQREDEEVCGVTELLVSGQFCMLLYS